jgi:hypothetical protein
MLNSHENNDGPARRSGHNLGKHQLEEDKGEGPSKKKPKPAESSGKPPRKPAGPGRKGASSSKKK